MTKSRRSSIQGWTYVDIFSYSPPTCHWGKFTRLLKHFKASYHEIYIPKSKLQATAMLLYRN